MASPSPADNRHRAYMRQALDLARQSPPKPSNFRVGAVLVDAVAAAASDPSDSSDSANTRDGDAPVGDVHTRAVLATGYTLELPGNTHAEQCCLAKLAATHGVAEEQLADLPVDRLPRQLDLYTTMEPCSFRLSGNLPCVQRVLRLAGTAGTPSSSATPRQITVYVGVTEPDTFVAHNTGRQTLEAAGIRVVHVPGLEPEILAVATAGHEPKDPASAE